MDVTALASVATQMSQARTGEAVQVAVLRKALDVQAQGALQLIQAAALQTNNPPHLGNVVDTFA
ncbi:MAG: YjfB family protein [Rhodocyclaceae bacterium]|jgi:hypothetical protein|nr:YjfB family protein [Rhodocyclaceae bacterium]